MSDRWMTYAEIGFELGIAKESARQKALRGRWRRQKGNDGILRVLVPEEVFNNKSNPFEARHEATHEARPGPLPVATHEARPDPVVAFFVANITKLESEVQELRETANQVHHLQADLAVAISAVTAAEERATKAEHQAAAERARVDGLVDQLTDLSRKMMEAQTAQLTPAKRSWWRWGR